MPEEHAWIEMSDGVKLATSLYLPETEPPWPVVLEALPYRKDDVTASYTPEYRRLRDEGDLAVARIDVRGTGSSEGIAIDEYPAQNNAICAKRSRGLPLNHGRTDPWVCTAPRILASTRSRSRWSDLRL